MKSIPPFAAHHREADIPWWSVMEHFRSVGPFTKRFAVKKTHPDNASKAAGPAALTRCAELLAYPGLVGEPSSKAIRR